jgi:hypothetical protein
MTFGEYISTKGLIKLELAFGAASLYKIGIN